MIFTDRLIYDLIWYFFFIIKTLHFLLMWIQFQVKGTVENHKMRENKNDLPQKNFINLLLSIRVHHFTQWGNIKLVCLRVSTKSKKINSYHLKPIHSLGGSSSHCLRQNDFQWSLSDCRSKISDVMYYVGSCSCSFFFGCVVYVCGFQENEMT